MCGASSVCVCVYTSLYLSLSSCVVRYRLLVCHSLTASGSVCVLRARNERTKMAADSGMETCPSPEIADSRKRPLDCDAENGATKRSHYGSGIWIFTSRDVGVNSSSRASNLATRHDTLVVVGDFIRSLARSLALGLFTRLVHAYSRIPQIRANR